MRNVARHNWLDQRRLRAEWARLVLDPRYAVSRLSRRLTLVAPPDFDLGYRRAEQPPFAAAA